MLSPGNWGHSQTEKHFAATEVICGDFIDGGGAPQRWWGKRAAAEVGLDNTGLVEQGLVESGGKEGGLV